MINLVSIKSTLSFQMIGIMNALNFECIKRAKKAGIKYGSYISFSCLPADILLTLCNTNFFDRSKHLNKDISI
jgi:hypothetical protein